ncbi:MAG: glycosyltransferase family 4 protein [Rhodothermales bacterium]|nr:glycosyltransferase family 4 protein [Rhodothermales bacterium]
MKIALFHTTLPEPGRKPGGVEVAVHRLADELAKNTADEVTVFSLSPAPAGFRYHHVRLFEGLPAFRDNPLLRLFGLPLLLNGAGLRGFDVLHLHGDDWFLFARSGASVRTLHGSALFEARSATSLKRRLAQLAVYPLEHLAARLATVTLAVGPKTAEVYGLTQMANNGVNLELFHPGEKAAAPTILYIGTWEGRKRGRFMFETFVEHILPARPDAELIMVADHAPAHERVRNVRFPDDATLAALYRQAWVFAYPSVYEGFGIPYIEAMASGTPVVCSTNDGAEYVLENGRYGAITPDDAFGDAIVGLLNETARREAMAKAGLARAAVFSWHAVARQHRQVYEDAIRLRRNGHRTNGSV